MSSFKIARAKDKLLIQQNQTANTVLRSMVQPKKARLKKGQKMNLK